jgi:hypothetical protein
MTAGLTRRDSKLAATIRSIGSTHRLVGRRNFRPALAKLCQLEVSVPVWSLQDGDLRPDALEPDNAVHPLALDRRLARSSSPSVAKNATASATFLDDYADVFHPLDRHVLDEGTR